MAAFVSITAKTTSALRGLEQLGDPTLSTAIRRSLTRTANSARADLASLVAKDTGLKVSDVRREIRVGTNIDARLARVETEGGRIPLIRFRATGPYPSRGRGRGVTGGVTGQRKVYPGAFIATVRGALPGGVVSSGHKGVFKRRGAARLPIRELFGPSIPHVFAKFLPEAADRAAETLAKNIEHEFEFALTRVP